MTPEELAARHPYLYHATDPVNLSGILQHGLRSTRSVLELHGWDRRSINTFVRTRRSGCVPVRAGQQVVAMITDNKPLVESKLHGRLQDGLTLPEWCAMLNTRVFFFPDERRLDAFLRARPYRQLDRQVLVFDTLKLARAYAGQMELAPINTGAALFMPAALRGYATFTPLLAHPYEQWRRLRRDRREVTSLDTIREVTITGGWSTSSAISRSRTSCRERRMSAGPWMAYVPGRQECPPPRRC